MSRSDRGDVSRRQFIGGGLSALTMGVLAHRGLAFGGMGPQSGESFGMSVGRTSPLRHVPFNLQSNFVQGLPFADWFTGDDFTDKTGYPFHNTPPCCGDSAPDPGEHVRVAIVGGGISGLATGVMLQDYRPVIFELHEQFGGNAAGESWNGINYSLGSAYVIVPDPGSFLESFYTSLGLDRVFRYAGPQDPIELGGQLLFDFWTGAGQSPQEQQAFKRYAEVVRYMAEKSYPEIPLPEGKDNQWILDLDRKNFLQDIEDQMGMPMPPLLAAAVQGYFYSSFGAGMQNVSAASGWNFLAAEEFGRWVFPGGNAYMAWAMWQRLSQLDNDVPASSRPYHLRSKCTVIDVRLRGDAVQVTYLDPSNQIRALTADYVVMANSKHIAKYMLHDLEHLDPAKHQAFDQVTTIAYLVANVLLEEPVALDFYDLFLIGDETFPIDPALFELAPRIVDVLSGHYARPPVGDRCVLTLYMPLPYGTNLRASLIIPDPWIRYAEILAPQVRRILGLLGVSETAVRQIRMTRWGHAMPLAQPNLIADGGVDLVQRPIADRIFFVNQDNWSLPAVENSLLDARKVSRAIRFLIGA